MNRSEESINLELLKEINKRKINFPDFSAMGKVNMAKFIWHNMKYIKNSNLNDYEELAASRTALELEIWSKEIYCQIQDSLKLLVSCNPSLTISINTDVL